MLPMLLAAQMLAVTPPQQPAYSSPALRDLVARAADRNLAVPQGLGAYRADVESEIAVLTRRADGEEVAVSIEQAHNEVQWQRSGEFTQHVIGYRGRLAGPSISSLAVLRKAWTIPNLYGNRLSLFFGQDSAIGPLYEDIAGEPTPAGLPSGSTLAVHPFAPRRDQVYQFSGGDTVATIRTRDRDVTVVRVQVDPRAEQAEWPVVVFRGEINLDAETGEIARMRGQFITLGHRGQKKQRVLLLPVSVTAYVDLEAVLLDGRFWLPGLQRIEQHVNVRGLAEGRAVFRIVSRFSDHHILRSSAGVVSLASGEMGDAPLQGVEATPRLVFAHRLTLASPDSLARPRSWLMPLGGATAELRADDFADVGAESFALPSSPSMAWRAQRLADLVHFNRVEGWSTGAAIEGTPGASLPNLHLRANGTWAWTEQTLRGRVELMRVGAPGEWSAGARFGRTLDITNDFTAPYDSGGSVFASFFGIDRYDYVDRRAATLWLNLNPLDRRAALRFEAGVGRDNAALARLTRGLFPPDVPFGPNRGVDAGRYTRASIVAEWNPAMDANTLLSGFGAQLRHEAAAGQLDWQRTTLRMIAREELGRFALGARIDAGALLSSNAPPQQLFEFGGEPSFPGYEPREFAGDRALAAQARAMYHLPLLRSPLRMFGCTCFAAPAPSLGVSVHGARLSATGASTLASIARLGSVEDQVGQPAVMGGTPLSRPTDGWRGSVEFSLRFFGGAASLGMARVMEAGAPWRARFVLGQNW
ncbi:MAG TPA: hypothetical protein VNM36_00450 [Gemmatimonadaceae bacterium]|nr:hypothetical protein [Gemmatimonadaceae bacterium]